MEQSGQEKKNESALLKLIKARKKKEENRPKEKTSKEKRNNTKKWCSFYRRNINLYASRHLKIRLHPFQHIMLYLMGVSQVFFAICSRGLSKSFIVGLFAMCKCLLYPYSEVHLTATTINQAKKMVKNKMEGELCDKLSPILKYYKEIGLITFHYGKEEIRVEFHLGDDPKKVTSTIWVDPADEQSRGGRATLLIYEECRLLKKTIIDSVFEKMAHPRQAIFMNLPKYSGDPRWIEECQSIYITSARFKNEWFWNTFKKVVSECYMNKKIPYNFFAGDIFLSIFHGLKTKADYFKGRKQSGELDFRMEDLNEMIGEAEDAFFSRDLFKKNQIVKNPFTPPSIQNIVQCNTQEELNDLLNNRPKQEQEWRLLFIDYAFANTTSKEDNDNSVIGCLSLIYDAKKDKFIKKCEYITTHPASDSYGMERKIRELFWDYQCDYIIFDSRNGGEIYHNNLTKMWEHPERPSSKWNPHGFTISIENDLQVVPQGKLDDLKSRTVDENAIPCLIPIVGTAELNSVMWMDLQKTLRNEEIDFLIEDIDYESMIEEDENYFLMTSEERAFMKAPFVNTMALINEAVNLSQEWRDGKVKLSEPRTGTKDMIISLAYGNYIATLKRNKIEKQMNDDEINDDDWDWMSESFI